MSVTTSPLSLRTELSEDQLTATLVIAGDVDRALLDAGLIHDVLDQAHVVRSAEVEAAVATLLAAPPPAGKTAHVVVSRGRAVRHGQDGRIEWSVDHAEDEPVDADRSFYDRSAFVTVRPDQVLGRIIPPTPGRDGVTVTGVVLTARQGRPAALKTDDSIRIEPDGRIVAATEGILHRANDRVSIQQRLVVESNVDFSTGNVDFHGDVTIKRDVRDCFTVKAGGAVEVAGRIEAATIECGGDLLAHGGVTGRGRGRVNVGGDLLARYLDAVQGCIDGDLKVQREMLNCDLVICGQIASPHAAIIGGKFIVQGKVHVSTLGSAAAVPTELVLGTVPRLDPFAARLAQLVSCIQERLADRQRMFDQLRGLCVRGNTPHTLREQLSTLVADIARLDQQRQRAVDTHEALTKRIADVSTFRVVVERCAHAGVMMTYGDRTYRLTDDVIGPVWFGRNSDGAPVYGRGDKMLGRLVQIASSRLAAQP
jgi:uncharacterized protein (DUF342 family)